MEWLAMLEAIIFKLGVSELAMISGVLGSIERYPHLATVASFSIFGDVMT